VTGGWGRISWSCGSDPMALCLPLSSHSHRSATIGSAFAARHRGRLR
jgi:hypothetical protein